MSSNLENLSKESKWRAPSSIWWIGVCWRGRRGQPVPVTINAVDNLVFDIFVHMLFINQVHHIQNFSNYG